MFIWIICFIISSLALKIPIGGVVNQDIIITIIIIIIIIITYTIIIISIIIIIIMTEEDHYKSIHESMVITLVTVI